MKNQIFTSSALPINRGRLFKEGILLNNILLITHFKLYYIVTGTHFFATI